MRKTNTLIQIKLVGACLSFAACAESTIARPDDPVAPAETRFSSPAAPPSRTLPAIDLDGVEPGSTPRVPQGPTGPVENPVLAGREVDFSQALRTASLKLVGDLPTLDELNGVTDRSSYERQIDAYLADPRFAGQMRAQFQNVMKMAGDLTVRVGNNNRVLSLDSAPTFAAQLVVESRSMNELFTATTNTCPTFNAATGAFTAAACVNRTGNNNNNTTPRPSIGVLTDAGMMAHFFSNMAFRRVRWVQETFACAQFPAEYAAVPATEGNAAYIAPWPFLSITGGQTSSVDFHDTSSVVCANCHATMNHQAPLFTNFDAAGAQAATSQVPLPTEGSPPAQIADFLPAGENTAWRFGTPASDLTQLGQAMAADPEVARCFVTRSWNWAMSRGDVVNDLSIVPEEVIADLVADFIAGGNRLRPTLRAIFTHDDFVRF